MAGNGGKRLGAGRKPSTLKGIVERLPKESSAFWPAQVEGCLCRSLRITKQDKVTVRTPRPAYTLRLIARDGSPTSESNMEPRKVNPGRHQRYCLVCAHEKREQIEADFVSWRSSAAIAAEYALADRASVYRHEHALNLFEKRKRNVKAALERIIEKAGEVEVTASAVVAAIQAYTKINSAGQWIERTEQLNLNDLFDRMSDQELEEYAREGKLPAWFLAATPENRHEP